MNTSESNLKTVQEILHASLAVVMVKLAAVFTTPLKIFTMHLDSAAIVSFLTIAFMSLSIIYKCMEIRDKWKIKRRRKSHDSDA